MEDTTAEQAKQHLSQLGDHAAMALQLLATPGPFDAHGEAWPLSGTLIAAQAHALLYIGDQVKALVELLAARPVPGAYGVETWEDFGAPGRRVTWHDTPVERERAAGEALRQFRAVRYVNRPNPEATR